MLFYYILDKKWGSDVFLHRHLHLETILTYWVLIYSLIVLQPILNILFFFI